MPLKASYHSENRAKNRTGQDVYLTRVHSCLRQGTLATCGHSGRVEVTSCRKIPIYEGSCAWTRCQRRPAQRRECNLRSARSGIPESTTSATPHVHEPATPNPDRPPFRTALQQGLVRVMPGDAGSRGTPGLEQRGPCVGREPLAQVGVQGSGSPALQAHEPALPDRAARLAVPMLERSGLCVGQECPTPFVTPVALSVVPAVPAVADVPAVP